MTDSPNIPADWDIDAAELVWQEYRYRHEHIWGTVFRLTAAAVILSVMPYTAEKVVQVLKWAVLAAPALGLLLVGFAALRIRRELRLLKQVKKLHRAWQQNKFRNWLDSQERDHEGKFEKHVGWYLGGLFFVGCLNFVALVTMWIPSLILR